MSLTEFDIVIGLEVHAELLTASKMYCGCANQPGARPNINVCPVCLGLPGAMPVINQRALELTALTGLALNCKISEFSRFDRKNYFYPDLPKGYQISQYQHPISVDGWLDVELEAGRHRVGIRRVHLEEDTAKLGHRVETGTGQPETVVDMNRSGVPLIEIVSDPDIASADEARRYLMTLRSIVQYLGASNGNMEEGTFRCDANVSIRPPGAAELGTKVEIKNMNSFRAVYRALSFEARRQDDAIRQGERIVQETRGWDEDRGITVSQRTKEQAHDYRYFPEPDLPPLSLTEAWVDGIRLALPELPRQRRDRFVSAFGLSPYDAELLTTERSTADFFEAVVERFPNAKHVANWMTGELFRLLNAADQTISQSQFSPNQLADLLRLIDTGVISNRAAKDVLDRMFATGESAIAVVDALGLNQISDSKALERLVEEAITANPKSVADFRAGKSKAVGFLVGQVMRASRGKANPTLVNSLLQARLTANG